MSDNNNNSIDPAQQIRVDEDFDKITEMTGDPELTIRLLSASNDSKNRRKGKREEMKKDREAAAARETNEQENPKESQ